MKLVKMFGLVAIAALASMAFVGVTSASANEDTTLCKIHQEPCAAGNQFQTLHVEDDGSNLLLTDILDVLCLHVLGVVGVLGLAEAPTKLGVHVNEILFANCGSNAAHNNCTVKVNEIPLFLLLKTELNLGKISADGGLVLVQCTVAGIFKISCEYGPNPEFENEAEGAGHTEGAGDGMITLDDAPALLEEGGILCPEESTLDALLEPLPDESVFIVS